MCWKQEWAAAISNLCSAIKNIQKQRGARVVQNLKSATIHIHRAQMKLEKRLDRNERTLTRLSNSKKFNYSKMLDPVKKRIAKNTKGIKECKEIIADLKAAQMAIVVQFPGFPKHLAADMTNSFKRRQDQLFRMIHEYGIFKSKNPARTYQLMGKYEIPNDFKVQEEEI